MLKGIQYILSILTGSGQKTKETYGELERFLLSLIGTAIFMVAILSMISVGSWAYFLYELNVYLSSLLGIFSGVILAAFYRLWIIAFHETAHYNFSPLTRYLLVFIKLGFAFLLAFILLFPIDSAIYEGEIASHIQKENHIAQQLQDQGIRWYPASMKLIEFHNKVELSPPLSKHFYIQDYLFSEHKTIAQFLFLLKFLFLIIYLVPVIVLFLYPFQRNQTNINSLEQEERFARDSFPKLSTQATSFPAIDTLIDYTDQALDLSHSKAVKAYLQNNPIDAQVVQGIELFGKHEKVEREVLKYQLDKKWDTDIRTYFDERNND